MAKMNLINRTAIITGAANGIGRATSIALAKRKCNIIITDINEEGLDETAQMIKTQGVTVQCAYLDVADGDNIKKFADRISAEHDKIDVLVNNAGVATGGSFEQLSEEEYDWLMNINFQGVVRMTRAFLPMLKQSDDARLVNVSSVFGLFAPPGQTAYSASKYAVRGFSESLRHEFELLNIPVGVSVVHPGGIATDIAKNARVAATVDKKEYEEGLVEFEKSLTLPPEIAGETIVKGIEKRQNRILIGNDARAISVIVRLFPVGYMKVLERLFKT